MPYRLSLDIGTNSIGWSILDLDENSSPVGFIDGGVRIFSDGRENKTETSLAAARRTARQARRRRDRLIKRRERLMAALIRHGLMPENEAERKKLVLLDPYELRARGLSKKLRLHELGRALFHLNQRRGFKSSRKVARDDDAPKIKPAIERLRYLMGDMTYGQYLHTRREQGMHVRARKVGEGAAGSYDIYPERSLVEDEFNRLWQAQTAYHPGLSQEARDQIHNIIFYQRPLKPVSPGRCTLEPEEERCPRALPLAQRSRILQELNHMQVVLPSLSQRSLSKQERDLLLDNLLKKKKVTFAGMRKTLKLPPGSSFNLEGEKRDALKGDETGTLIGGKKAIGAKWFKLSPDEQNQLVHIILEAEDDEELVAQLAQEWDLAEEEAEKLAALDLPAGYARLSEKALAAIVPQLEADVISYSEAVKRAGYQSHSDLGSKQLYKRLPYYGIALERHVTFGSNDPRDPLADQFGRVANPTVHIALNQLRRVVNELIKLIGPPAEVVLEVARDLKNSPLVRLRIEKQQAENQKRNEKFKETLAELGLADRGDGVLRLRLWEEANRRCPYTGQTISIEKLFAGEVEIEHILPFTRTLDDGISNKTICLREANRDKGNRTPFEAFGGSPGKYDWQGITARAMQMPRNKRWRFAEDAMEQFERDGDFLARQLIDNQYIARLAREYLTAICPANKVWVTPGRLTYLLSRRWGFPIKNRDDHRHHALDAMLIGVTDRALLKRVADTHKKNQDQGTRRFLTNLEPPWPGFREDAMRVYDRIIVSHRPDHGIQGQLHNETAYGIAQDSGQARNAEHRVPVSGIKKPSDLLLIKGRRLRAEILSYVTGESFKECRNIMAECDGMALKDAKIKFKKFCNIDDKAFIEKAKKLFRKRGMRRIRICEKINLIPIKDRDGKPYKGFKGDSNAYFDIYMGPDGKWTGTIVSTFDANQKEFKTEIEIAEDYEHVTRLFRNDMLEIDHSEQRTCVYVVKLSQNQIALAPHNEANVDKRNRDNEDGFKLIYKSSPAALQKAGARPVYLSPAGRLLYPEVPRHAAELGGDSR
jgi:CRISPR-associated endonuclease Csn1